MDPERFDRLAITLTRARTRRSALGLLSTLGLTSLRAQGVAAQACLVNGARCGGGRGTCCSGRCVRKRGTHKRFCRQAPGQGICTIASNSCAISAPNIVDCDQTGSLNCQCFVTSAGFSFCGVAPEACVACTTNPSCEKRIGGSRGDRCVACEHCGSGTNFRACVTKCPNPATL